MQHIDMEYFSEYKTVERICRDMYGADGVKAYIEEMEGNKSKEKMHICQWDNTLRTLKHLKWLRNQIAHDNESYEVTEQDLSDIKMFHEDLLTQQDPLALLYKETERMKKMQQEYTLSQKTLQYQESNFKNEYQTDYQNNADNEAKLFTVAAIVAVIIVIAAVIFFFCKN